MNEKLNYEVGDIVKLKKTHPCGSSQWEILRVGADFRLKCMGCGHQIMIARRLVEKNTRGLPRQKRIPKQPPPGDTAKSVIKMKENKKTSCICPGNLLK